MKASRITAVVLLLTGVSLFSAPVLAGSSATRQQQTKVVKKAKQHKKTQTHQKQVSPDLSLAFELEPQFVLQRQPFTDASFNGGGLAGRMRVSLWKLTDSQDIFATVSALFHAVAADREVVDYNRPGGYDEKVANSASEVRGDGRVVLGWNWRIVDGASFGLDWSFAAGGHVASWARSSIGTSVAGPRGEVGWGLSAPFVRFTIGGGATYDADRRQGWRDLMGLPVMLWDAAAGIQFTIADAGLLGAHYTRESLEYDTGQRQWTEMIGLFYTHLLR